MIKEIKIDNGICFKCGKSFDNSPKGFESGINKTDHHSIPKVMKPKFNVTVPLHDKCHKELNNLYAKSQKKVKPIGLPMLKRLLNNFEGLVAHHNKFNPKAEKFKKIIVDNIKEGAL